jgi:dolichol-phosphate mannosyltransferase
MIEKYRLPSSPHEFAGPEASAREWAEPTADRLDSQPCAEALPGTNIFPRPGRVFIVLPAYNEEEALETLLFRIHETFLHTPTQYQVIVVDDGSSDDTPQIASRLSFHMPIELVRHEVNQGLGGALRTGLKKAVQWSEPHDFVVTMDSDNTHPPELILRMVADLREGRDVVIASRYRSGARVVGVPWHRNLLSLAARLTFISVFPIRGVRDYTSSFRAFRASVLQKALQHYGDGFVTERGFSCMSDVLLKLRKRGILFSEVPLVLRYDLKGGVSKMNVWRTIKGTLCLIARRRMGARE